MRSLAGRGSPSTVILSAAVTLMAGLSSTWPLRVTRPSAIIASASRREAMPARAITLAMRSSTGSCGSAWDGRALLAGAMGLLAVTVEAARTLVSGTAAEGAVAFVAARTERLVPGAAGAERLVASLATGAEGLLVAALEAAGTLVVVAAAERLVAGLAGLARAVVVAAGAEGAFAALAGFAEGPVTGSAAAVGASWRTAPAIIVVAVGHGSLIAEECWRSER